MREAAMAGFKHMAALGGVVRKTVMRGYPSGSLLFIP
jgi:hypothetical protein